MTSEEVVGAGVACMGGLESWTGHLADDVLGSEWSIETVTIIFSY